MTTVTVQLRKSEKYLVPNDLYIGMWDDVFLTAQEIARPAEFAAARAVITPLITAFNRDRPTVQSRSASLVVRSARPKTSFAYRDSLFELVIQKPDFTEHLQLKFHDACLEVNLAVLQWRLSTTDHFLFNIGALHQTTLQLGRDGTGLFLRLGNFHKDAEHTHRGAVVTDFIAALHTMLRQLPKLLSTEVFTK